METREGFERALTCGEVVLARSVYGNSIFYNDVKVHCDSYFPFGLQVPAYAMAPMESCGFEKRVIYPTSREEMMNLSILSYMKWLMSGSTRKVCG